MQTLPYWRLSGFYFFYFFFVGAFAPYWTLYLQSLKFDAMRIAILMSLLQVMRTFAPALWGWLADHSGRRIGIVRVAALLSLVSYLGVFGYSSFPAMFMIMAVMSFFLERIVAFG